MLRVEVKFSDAGLQAALAGLAGDLEATAELHQAMAGAVAETVRAHLLERNSRSPNTGFYAKASNFKKTTRICFAFPVWAGSLLLQKACVFEISRTANRLPGRSRGERNANDREEQRVHHQAAESAQEPTDREIYFAWTSTHGPTRARIPTSPIDMQIPQPGPPGRRENRAQLKRQAQQDFAPPLPPLVATPSVGRNQSCPCGSGRKFEKCCGW